MIFKDAFELVSKNKRFKGREKLEENVKKLIDAHEEIDEEKLFQLLDEVYKVEDKSEDSVDVEDETKSEEDQEGMSATQIAKAIEDAVALALEKQQKALDEREEKSNKLEDAINEAKVEANKEIEELTKRLDASRKEIRYLHSDIESLTLEIANKVSEARKARVNHITDMRRLSGEDVDFSKVSDELKEKSGEEILVALSDASNKVDTQKIIDTLSSGLTNDPNASVSNPTLIDDNIKTRSVRKLTDTEKEQVRTQWLKINITSGNEIADNWLNDTCKNLGISTEEFTSEKK